MVLYLLPRNLLRVIITLLGGHTNAFEGRSLGEHNDRPHKNFASSSFTRLYTPNEVIERFFVRSKWVIFVRRRNPSSVMELDLPSSSVEIFVKPLIPTSVME